VFLIHASQTTRFRPPLNGYEQFGIEVSKRGRPPKDETEKYEAISIRLHPKVIQWAKTEANKRGVGYQTVINETLLKFTD
jgi:uncharacterized protein (DUF4415 family)